MFGYKFKKENHFKSCNDLKVMGWTANQRSHSIYISYYDQRSIAPLSSWAKKLKVLRKTVFFIFWGPLWYFLDPKTLDGIRNLTFGGVILLTFFDPSYGFRDFWGRWCQNMEFSTPKPLLWSKNVKSMIPQKWGFWCQIRFCSLKNIKGGPKKWKKNFFSQKRHILCFT